MKSLEKDEILYAVHISTGLNILYIWIQFQTRTFGLYLGLMKLVGPTNSICD